MDKRINMKIRGEKVTLLPITQEEKDEFYALATESSGSKFWYDDQERSVLDKRKFFREWHESYFNPKCPEEGQCFWIDVSGERIGAVCHNRIDLKNKVVELDIIIGEEKFCGKGYGTDALITLMVHVFTNFDINRIWIGARANNQRAIKAYQKAGFKKEAVLRETDFFEGKFVDCVILRILRKEFEKR